MIEFKMPKAYPTQQELKALLSYSADTGCFSWLRDRNPRVKAGAKAGCRDRSGLYIKIGDKNFAAHRLAYIYMHGRLPDEGCNIDHVNGDNTDNRWINLRQATYSQNSCNRASQSNSRTGVKGVCFHTQSARWRVQVRAKGVKGYSGFFEDFELACLVAKEAQSLYHKNFVRS